MHCLARSGTDLQSGDVKDVVPSPVVAAVFGPHSAKVRDDESAVEAACKGHVGEQALSLGREREG